MRELLATERVVLDAIITLFVKLGHNVSDHTQSIATAAAASSLAPVPALQ